MALLESKCKIYFYHSISHFKNCFAVLIFAFIVAHISKHTLRNKSYLLWNLDLVFSIFSGPSYRPGSFNNNATTLNKLETIFTQNNAFKNPKLVKCKDIKMRYYINNN